MSARLLLLVLAMVALGRVGFAQGGTEGLGRAGESTHVLISDDGAVVTSVFELSGAPEAGEERDLFLAIFGDAGKTSSEVMDGARLSVQSPSGREYKAAATEAPEAWRGVRWSKPVFWFRIPVEEASFSGGDAVFLQISYRQLLLDGRFHYLPVIDPDSRDYSAARNWAHQLWARRLNRPLKVVRAQDPVTLGASTVVYLKNGQEVVLQ